MRSSRHRLRLWGAKLLLFAASAVAGVLLLEFGAGVVYSRYHKRPFDRDEIQSRLLTNRTSGAPIRRLDPELAERLEKIKTANLPDAGVVLHPYFGFIVNPTAEGINQFGFFADSPLVEPDGDTVTVALFGGSLTDQVFYMARDALVDALHGQARFAGRPIRVISTALGGYKQPQQLNALAYFLARGAAYDVVVNLDGFNEIDAPMENVNAGVNPYFPFNWKLHARRGLDPAATVLLGRIDLIRQRRNVLRNWFATPPFVRSTFFLTLWDAIDRRFEAAQRGRVAELGDLLANSGQSPRVRGPAEDVDDRQTLFSNLVHLWERASLQMRAMCDAYGIEYVHLLQPNQYVPGTKELTEEELANAFDPDEPIRERVATGYPLLRESGRALRDSGENFVDLTMMFADEPRTVYSDTCCHVNELGARQIAERIAAAVGAGA